MLQSVPNGQLCSYMQGSFYWKFFDLENYVIYSLSDELGKIVSYHQSLVQNYKNLKTRRSRNFHNTQDFWKQKKKKLKLNHLQKIIFASHSGWNRKVCRLTYLASTILRSTSSIDFPWVDTNAPTRLDLFRLNFSHCNSMFEIRNQFVETLTVRMQQTDTEK